MKRIISLILCVILIFPSIYVCAEEEYTFYKVNVDAGEGVKSLKAVVNDGEIYIRTKDFSKITRYCFDDATSSFLVDGQGFEKAFKWVQIDTKNKKIRVKTHELDLDNFYEINNELYLPFSQMLPILNACIYEIKDDVIYIANNKISLAEILYDFDIQDYWFNMSDEFANKDFLAVAFVVPSYIFDTVVDFRFDRLDIFTHSGDFNDYKDIFSEFLADDNLYLEAMAKEPTVLDETADFFSSVNSTSKKLKSIYGWVEQAGKSEIDSKTGGKLLDALKESYDSKELEYDNLKGLNDAWTSGTISFADVFESLNYAYTYMTQVQDNRQMLNSVYKVNKKIYDKETDRRAAKQVYDLYGKKVVTAITKEIVGKLTEDAIKDLISPIAIYEATAKVAGIAINAAIPYDAGDIAKMPLYANIISSASSKYHSYSTETDEETTNLRLSLLLSMISSKKCFEIMKDTSEGVGKNSSYYQGKIEKIDKLIMALYMAEENTEFDSYEHFEDYKNKNKNAIGESKILNHLDEYDEIPFTNTRYKCRRGDISNYLFLYEIQFNDDGSVIGNSENNRMQFAGTYKFDGKDNIDIIFTDVKNISPSNTDGSSNISILPEVNLTMKLVDEYLVVIKGCRESVQGSIYSADGTDIDIQEYQTLFKEPLNLIGKTRGEITKSYGEITDWQTNGYICKHQNMSYNIGYHSDPIAVKASDVKQTDFCKIVYLSFADLTKHIEKKEFYAGEIGEILDCDYSFEYDDYYGCWTYNFSCNNCVVSIMVENENSHINSQSRITILKVE